MLSFSRKQFSDSREKKGFYGWIALSGAVFALIITCSFGQSFGVFLPKLTAEFGWSRAGVAAAFSLSMLALGLLCPLWGILAARFGPRINIILGNTLVSAGFAALYFLHELWFLYVLFVLIGLGSGLGGSIQSTTVANNWFTKKVSMAQGIIGSASGLAGFIFPPLATALIVAVGWRPSWLILGGIVFMGASVIGGMVLVRNRPEDLGQVPDGIEPEPIEVKITERTLPEKSKIAGRRLMKEILQMPVTWFIFAFVFANAFIAGTVFTHQVAHVQDIGFTPMTAATTMSILAVGSIVSSLTFGVLALRVNIRYLAVAAFILQLLAFIIILTSRGLGWIYIYSALVGMGYGALLTAFPTFIGAYYERRQYSQLMGLAMAIHNVAAAAAGTIGGIIFDARGNYSLDFIIVLCLIVIGMVSVFLARKPKLQELAD
jgi:MFS family permease